MNRQKKVPQAGTGTGGEIVMAFCERCGKELGPGQKCDCQKVQKAKAAQAAEGAAAPEKKNNLAIIGAAAAAVVVVLGVIIFVVAGSSSYKTPVKELVKLINKQSSDVFAYQELIINPYEVAYNQDAYKILKKNDDYRDEFELAKEFLADFYDANDGFRISSCDFVKAEKMKGSALRDVQRTLFDSDEYEDLLEEFDEMDKGDYEDMADDLDISISDAKQLVKETKKALKAMLKAEVEDGYTVTLRFYVEYDGDEEKTEKIEGIKIIKLDGTWFIYNPSLMFEKFNFQNDELYVDMHRVYRYVNIASFGDF